MGLYSSVGILIVRKVMEDAVDYFVRGGLRRIKCKVLYFFKFFFVVVCSSLNLS